MRFRVLGSLGVWDGRAWLPVRAAQQRTVLAVLLVSAGRVVTTERLVDELWGRQPPRSAVVTVQGYVRRLRRLLGAGASDLLVTRGRGYELVLGAADLDAAEFESLVAAGKRAVTQGRFPVAETHFRAALELWRGAAFEDVPGSATVAAEAARLERVRLGALEERIGAELALGRHAEVVDELLRLAGEHPTRERLWAQLMVGLYRCGRRDDALAAYQDADRALAETLGLEPGPELRELRQRVHTDDRELADPASTAPVRVPARLPPDIATFTGREADLRRLDAVADRGTGSPVLVIATIAGTAGVGKTALAVRWAHRVRDRFPDGQLYVNLRGYAAGPPLRPIDALAYFLSALGVPAEECPADEERAAALYRSLLADTGTLVVLDNASSAEQVRPLLPAGAGCLALVTSRDQLRGLVASDGAIRLDLDVLGPDEAADLLTRLLGADRVRSQWDTLGELARLCGYLPLALRIAAANLTARPQQTIARYSARLRTERLAALHADAEAHPAVQVAFDHSYTALPTLARGLFRLLGLVPGPDITVPAAAALAGIEPSAAAVTLDRLARAHLVAEHAPGRFAAHDLIRHYAADRAGAEDSPDIRESALGRLFEHYLRTVDAAARLLYPHTLRVPRSDGPKSAGFQDYSQAREWLEAERANLIAAIHHASTHGPLPAAWRLADALRGYFVLSRNVVDWEAVAHEGLVAAEADGDLHARAASHINVASWLWIRDEARLAVEHYTPALALSRQAGWAQGESVALSGLGNMHAELGQLRQAVTCHRAALAIDRRTGWLSGQSIKLGSLGLALSALGQLQLAADHLAESVAVAKQTASRMDQAAAMVNLGEAYHALGRLDDALDLLTRALAMHREIGARASEVEALRQLAAVHRDAGRLTEAFGLARTAVDLSTECGDRQVRAATLATMASVQLRLGRHDQAIAGNRQALDVGDRNLEVAALIGLASAYEHVGDTARAGDCARRALTIATAAGYRVREGQALTALAAARFRDGNHAEALELAERAVAVQAETGHRLGQAEAHSVAERALRRTGRDDEAAAHQERAGALFAEIGIPMTESDRLAQ
jgi:DNA-binding SARP family transcriptional activator